jgi:hypothetical protein
MTRDSGVIDFDGQITPCDAHLKPLVWASFCHLFDWWQQKPFGRRAGKRLFAALQQIN